MTEPGTEDWLDVNGGQLYLRRFGAGPPLVLVHGWALDHRMFRPQWSGLADSFEVIVFDRRGFGRSTAPPDLRRETDDLDRLCDHLALEEIHLLGMSQGGRIALRQAARRPERLRSLIVQGPAIDGCPAETESAERIPIADYVDLVRAGDLETFRRRWSTHPLMSLAHASAENRALINSILADYKGRDLLAFDEGHYAWPDDVLAGLARFRKPALLLTGARETDARKAVAAKLLETLPHAHEEVLSSGGHLSNLEEPEAYNAAVRRFCLAVGAP